MIIPVLGKMNRKVHAVPAAIASDTGSAEQTDDALSLAEASYPVVQYIPLGDVNQALLERTTTQSYCPYKGDASYYTVSAPDGRTEKDVIWTYEHPYPAVAEIAGHVAFYPDRAEITVDPA